MNSQPEEELQRRLQKLEAEINSFSPTKPETEAQKQTSPSGFAKLSTYAERSLFWFQSLSSGKKLVVGGAGMFVGFLVLQTVFKLVTSVISLALLAVLVYLGYKFFVSKSPQRKQ
jgi:hypothetical protein